MAMTKIDTSGWKEFVVGDLFETEKTGRNVQVPTGGWIATKNLVSGFTPRITVSGVNNGIAGYYEDIDDANYLVYENFISVSFLGTVFYQANKASLDMKVHCLKPLDIELNERIASFLITVIKISLGSILYSDQISSTVLPGLKIMVPVDVSGKPDWAYMDSFMTEVLKESEACLENLRLADENKTAVDISQWKEFQVKEIVEKLDLKFLPSRSFNKAFDISETKSDEFNLPLVNAKHFNNGIMYYGRENEWMSDSMTIDIVADGAASTGDVYAQPQKTGVLYNAYLVKPKVNVSEHVLFYLATIVQRCIKDHFGYDNKCTWDKVKEETIKLPIDDQGNPDWAYMDSYMGAVMQDAESSIEMLRKYLV